jgi:hypothetical protein
VRLPAAGVALRRSRRGRCSGGVSGLRLCPFRLSSAISTAGRNGSACGRKLWSGRIIAARIAALGGFGRSSTFRTTTTIRATGGGRISWCAARLATTNMTALKKARLRAGRERRGRASSGSTNSSSRICPSGRSACCEKGGRLLSRKLEEHAKEMRQRAAGRERPRKQRPAAQSRCLLLREERMPAPPRARRSEPWKARRRAYLAAAGKFAELFDEGLL